MTDPCAHARRHLVKDGEHKGDHDGTEAADGSLLCRSCCLVCGHQLAPTETQTCLRCIGRTRANLYAILDTYQLLPQALDRLGSNMPHNNGHITERSIPGGTALVLLAHGSNATQRLRAYCNDQDDDWDQDDRDGDPQSVAHELARWEDDWRRLRGEPAAPYPEAVPIAIDYLNRNTGWAGAYHPDFDEFATDIRHLRYRLEAVTNTSNQPARAPVRCFECGEHTLERHYRDIPPDGDLTKAGLEEDWTCRTCQRVYDQAAYLLAVRARLEEQATA